jgi:hypothetical protein
MPPDTAHTERATFIRGDLPLPRRTLIMSWVFSVILLVG